MAVIDSREMQRGAVALTVCLAVPLGASAQEVPTGFSTEPVAAGLNFPVGIAITNDGRILAVEKTGGIVACDLNGNTRLCGTVPDVVADGERALGGITVDPGWPTRPYVYVHFSSSDGMVRIARYTLDGDVDDPTSIDLTLGDRFEITSVPDTSPLHNGGTVRFGPDGMLYASVGDDVVPCEAQSHDDGRGTILRLDVSSLPDGPGGPPPIAAIAPPDNPFPSDGGLGPLVWSYGLRNPFRFHIDPLTGNLYVADVGGDRREELNEVTGRGLNFGWPVLEGSLDNAGCAAATPPFTPPIAEVDHGDLFLVAITFGGRYRNPAGGAFNFGVGYEGDVFFHDFILGELRRLKWNGAAWEYPPPELGQPGPLAWGTGFGNVTDAVRGPDGAIYYVNIATGEIHRLKSDTVGADRIDVVSGDDQVGVAGQSLPEPLVVSLRDATGVPIAGVPVTFSFLEGGGVLGPQPVVTDAAGIVTTELVLSQSTAVDPVIEAHTAGAVSATLSASWRGVVAGYYASTQTLLFNLRMATAFAPAALALDAPAAAPHAVTPFGDVWTSVLDPLPTLTVIHGLVTDADGVFAAAVPVPVSVDATFLAQAYGFDSSLAAPASVLVSNPATVTIGPNAKVANVEPVSAGAQAGTAGRPLTQPLGVRVTNEEGSPLAGAPVFFSVTAGSGVLDPQPRVTDAHGLASSNLVLSAADPTDPEVSAAALGSAPASFPIVWRGLLVDHSPGAGTLEAEVRLASPGAPVYLTWDPVQVQTPYLVTQFGSLWTSILEPQPTGQFVAGVTDATGAWSYSLAGVPPGTTLTVQGIGIEPDLPYELRLMVSLPEILSFD